MVIYWLIRRSWYQNIQVWSITPNCGCRSSILLCFWRVWCGVSVRWVRCEGCVVSVLVWCVCVECCVGVCMWYAWSVIRASERRIACYVREMHTIAAWGIRAWCVCDTCVGAVRVRVACLCVRACVGVGAFFVLLKGRWEHNFHIFWMTIHRLTMRHKPIPLHQLWDSNTTRSMVMPVNIRLTKR